MSLIEFRREGMYVPAADVYIDPTHRVPKALITHGHSDHSRWGHQQYICSALTKPIIQHRLGDIRVHGQAYGAPLTINGVHFTFYPAGHIVGSAQILVEHHGERWVVSGDYKVEDDGISGTFEPIPCHTFITECTFGLPFYAWLPQQEVYDQINAWWQQNQRDGVVSILTGYALGKAQRLLSGLDPTNGPIFEQGSAQKMTSVIRSLGTKLPAATILNENVSDESLEGSIIVTSSLSGRTEWMDRFEKKSIAAASGWMQLRKTRRNRGANRNFILSDHADWEGLIQTIRDTGATQVYAMHGYTDLFTRWLNEQGYDAHVVPHKWVETPTSS